MTDIKAYGNGICFINNWVPLLIHEMRRCNPVGKVCFKYENSFFTQLITNSELAFQYSKLDKNDNTSN